MKSKGKDKGVSEVVGYILTFSIVIATVTVIYTSGMPMVEQTSKTAVLQSVKTSFISLQSNVKKVALDQSPEAGWLNVTVDGTEHYNQSFGNIECTIGSKKVIYENGAIIEYTTGGNIIVSDPPIYFTNYSGNKNVFISVINVSGNFSAGGGVAEMHLRHDDTNVSILKDKNVTINIGSPHITSCSLTLVAHNVSI